MRNLHIAPAIHLHRARHEMAKEDMPETRIMVWLAAWLHERLCRSRAWDS